MAVCGRARPEPKTSTHKNRGVFAQTPRRRPDSRQNKLLRWENEKRLFVEIWGCRRVRAGGPCHRGGPRSGPGRPARTAPGRAHPVAHRHAQRRRTGAPPGHLRGQPGRLLMAASRQVHRHVLADPPPSLPGPPDQDATAARQGHLASQPAPTQAGRHRVGRRRLVIVTQAASEVIIERPVAMHPASSRRWRGPGSAARASVALR